MTSAVLTDANTNRLLLFSFEAYANRWASGNSKVRFPKNLFANRVGLQQIFPKPRSKPKLLALSPVERLLSFIQDDPLGAMQEHAELPATNFPNLCLIFGFLMVSFVNSTRSTTRSEDHSSFWDLLQKFGPAGLGIALGRAAHINDNGHSHL